MFSGLIFQSIQADEIFGCVDVGQSVRVFNLDFQYVMGMISDYVTTTSITLGFHQGIKVITSKDDRVPAFAI